MSRCELLNSGYRIPSVGLGTSRARDKELKAALNSALEIGYRHFDTAHVYGNEKAIGEVLKLWLSQGKLKREDIFITTKLPPEAIHADLVEGALNESLQALQLEYVDLYLIHSPIWMKKDKVTGKSVSSDTDHLSVWKAMEKQVEAGRTKSIGLSNFNTRQIQRIWDSAKIKPACLQVEIHPYLQQPELRDFCNKKGIIVVGFASLGSRGAGGTHIQPNNVLQDEVVHIIAKKYNKSPAQVILRYFVQNNVVMIPKSVTPDRQKQNFDLFSFSLDEDDVRSIKALNVGESARMMDLVQVDPKLAEHPEYPFGKRVST